MATTKGQERWGSKHNWLSFFSGSDEEEGYHLIGPLECWGLADIVGYMYSDPVFTWKITSTLRVV